MITDPSVRDVILSLADDEHLMGQQHTEWIGIAPFLEEDLAFSSIGQDELGHAAMLYELLVDDQSTPDDDVEAIDRAIDSLAFDRPAEEYRSCHLVELATDDWAEALIRHWLYDTAEELRWGLFAQSSIQELKEVAARAEREEAYHRRHAEGLLDALMVSPEATERLQTATRKLAPVAVGLFDPVAGQPSAVADGALSQPVEDLLPTWQAHVSERFPLVDWSGASISQHGRTARSTHFAPLMTRMREVLDLDPDAVW